MIIVSEAYSKHSTSAIKQQHAAEVSGASLLKDVNRLRF
jgi:hypothetical protein